MKWKFSQQESMLGSKDYARNRGTIARTPWKQMVLVMYKMETICFNSFEQHMA